MSSSRFIGLTALAAMMAALAGCGPNNADKGKAADATATAASPAPTAAPSAYTLVIQNHQFIPAEITVPANTAVALTVINKDPLAEEFDSSSLKVEKVIAGGDTGTVRLHPLEPGRYPFVGEYHSTTAKGVVVAQ